MNIFDYIILLIVILAVIFVLFIIFIGIVVNEIIRSEARIPDENIIALIKTEYGDYYLQQLQDWDNIQIFAKKYHKDLKMSVIALSVRTKTIIEDPKIAANHQDDNIDSTDIFGM